MQKGMENLQKTIIITSFILGLIICLAGLAYKYFFLVPAKVEAVHKPTPVPATGFYNKLKAGQSINILALGDSDFLNSNFSQLENMLETDFNLPANTSAIPAYKGTVWSNLMTFYKYQQTQSIKPDLILYFIGTNDPLELSLEQFKGIQEAVLRATGQAYPEAEIILSQPSDIDPAYAEALKNLAQHYNIPLVPLPKESEAASLASAILDTINNRLNMKIPPNKISQTKALQDTHKYEAWQRQETFSESYLMEKANVPETVPRMVGEKYGAFVESELTGAVVGVIFKCVPDGGLARVYIDKNRYQIIDTYSPEPRMRYLLINDDLEPGKHKVKMLALGLSKYPSEGKRIIWYGFDATGT